MDSIDSLIKQISLGEDSVLELKDIEYKNNAVSGSHRNSLADEMAAMANSYGGIVILGVNDKSHAITGLPWEKLDLTEKWVHGIANNLIKPPLDYRIKKLSVPSESGEKNIIRFLAMIHLSHKEIIHARNSGARLA